MDCQKERTFILVKPDGVQRGLIGKIITKFEQKGFKLVALKLCTASDEILQKHYAEHKGKSFFAGLVKFMLSGPVCAMVWEGSRVVETVRRLLGETDPLKSAPGTIRGDFGVCIGRNICHGSDSVESAEREISVWFRQEEMLAYSLSSSQWLYE